MTACRSSNEQPLVFSRGEKQQSCAMILLYGNATQWSYSSRLQAGWTEVQDSACMAMTICKHCKVGYIYVNSGTSSFL